MKQPQPGRHLRAVPPIKGPAHVPYARVAAICGAIDQHLAGPDRELGICAPMGFGKSSAIVEWVVSNCRKSGCIIVVEFRNKAEELAASINSLSTQRYSQKICQVWYGIKVDECRLIPDLADDEDERKLRDDLLAGKLCKDCDYKQCRAHPVRHQRTKEYPVLIITHARLRNLLRNNKPITKFSRWKRGHRRVMLIDELPYMVDDREISANLIEYLLEEEVLPCQKAAIEGMKHLQGVVRERKGKFPAYRHRLKIPAAADSDYKVIEKLCNHGGFVTAVKKQKFLKLAVHHPLNFKTIHKYVIFDGTMGIDPHYSELCKEMKVAHFGRPDEGAIRLHFWADQKLKTGLSRVIKRRPEQVKELISSIKSRHPQDKLLVITTLSCREKIEKMEIPGVVVRHFGALKGSNDLQEFGAVYFTHLFQHPPRSMLSLAVASGYWPRKTKLGSKKSASGRWGFKDLRMEHIRVRHIIASLVQDIYRTRIRGPDDSCRDVDVYLGLIDPSIVNGLLKYFPNIQFVEEKFSLRKKSVAKISKRRASGQV